MVPNQFSLGLTEAEARCSSTTEQSGHRASGKAEEETDARYDPENARHGAGRQRQEGTYRVARDIFTDPEIFELEMKHIFEGNWVYLAHESQIPNKNDYFTTYMAASRYLSRATAMAS